jgi:cell wall-associated NlpC family hydrolase
MPPSRIPLSANSFSRLTILAALTVGLLGTTTGIASADTAPPPVTGTGITDTGTSSDPGTPPTTGTTDPTDPTTTPATDPTITFTTPKATLHPHAGRARSARLRRRQWHAHAVSAVLREARRQAGKPYVYGADGPGAFDCSGLVRYVFGHAIGRWLPHNAAAQYDVVQHISRRELEPGDLVFQESGGYPFHVGIYAGDDKWWQAPHTGARVHKQQIYPGHLYYGRVLVYHGARHAKHHHQHHHRR